ncbi:MAG: hypothetical protein KC421_21625 [Anaerolineales bacterium]|nr:hypothetical protein [Anaerolineales bacterium]
MRPVRISIIECGGKAVLICPLHSNNAIHPNFRATKNYTQAIDLGQILQSAGSNSKYKSVRNKPKLNEHEVKQGIPTIIKKILHQGTTILGKSAPLAQGTPNEMIGQISTGAAWLPDVSGF